MPYKKKQNIDKKKIINLLSENKPKSKRKKQVVVEESESSAESVEVVEESSENSVEEIEESSAESIEEIENESVENVEESSEASVEEIEESSAESVENGSLEVNFDDNNDDKIPVLFQGENCEENVTPQENKINENDTQKNEVKGNVNKKSLKLSEFYVCFLYNNGFMKIVGVGSQQKCEFYKSQVRNPEYTFIMKCRDTIKLH